MTTMRFGTLNEDSSPLSSAISACSSRLAPSWRTTAATSSVRRSRSTPTTALSRMASRALSRLSTSSGATLAPLILIISERRVTKVTQPSSSTLHMSPVG